ncbi:MAG TPA: adenylosuccinate synthetase [Roseiflexaceae bacterium]|nr:adenylosuccinate synthetase [Roseiflexaceae bacterium]
MRQVFLTVDLGFGDSGKGTVVDFLTRSYDAHTVVRYNGGAQAGHRVVTGGDAPREHVFAQFGSGTLAGAATHLSRFMLIDPVAMLKEEEHLRELGIDDALSRTTIDERALVITPYHRAVNRLKERARGAGRHGSCGMGVGETVVDALAYGERVVFAGDLCDARTLRDKLAFLREVNQAKVRDLLALLPDDEQTEQERALLFDPQETEWALHFYRDLAREARIVGGDYLRGLLERDGTVVFEAAQGVLLDEWQGFHPHTTWSTTTLANADTLLAEAGYTGRQTRIGITRAYTTRHGAGPLVSEDAALTEALPDARNGFGLWQGGFRVGWLDVVMLRYALEAVGRLDYLAVTCLDRLAGLPVLRVCRRYRYDTFDLARIVLSPAPRDLDYQEQITRSLARCTPLLEDLPDAESLLRLLEAELGLPVRLTSAGPAAEHKRWRDM